MQLTQKHIVAFAAVAITAIIGYCILQNPTSSQSDEVKVNIISQSGIETDTGKRLATVANSGTQWGMSPFGSGKPLEEAEKKPEFKKPNTDWKTRTLNGITYVFGEGNPKEVGLNASEIAKLTDLARTQEVFYMTPEAEFGMKTFLDSSDLTTLLEKCHEQLAWSIPYPGEGYTFPHDLSMETMMYIDPKTGQKRFNSTNISNISASLGSLSRDNNWKQCMTNQDRYILTSSLEKWGKVISNYAFYETPLDPLEPIIRVPGPETNSPRPSWYNSGTPHDGDVTPFR